MDIEQHSTATAKMLHQTHVPSLTTVLRTDPHEFSTAGYIPLSHHFEELHKSRTGSSTNTNWETDSGIGESPPPSPSWSGTSILGSKPTSSQDYLCPPTTNSSTHTTSITTSTAAQSRCTPTTCTTTTLSPSRATATTSDATIVSDSSRSWSLQWQLQKCTHVVTHSSGLSTSSAPQVCSKGNST